MSSSFSAATAAAVVALCFGGCGSALTGQTAAPNAQTAAPNRQTAASAPTPPLKSAPPCPPPAAPKKPDATQTRPLGDPQYFWFEQLCAPKEYFLNQPIMTEDGRLVAVCDPKNEEYGYPREFRVIDTTTGLDVYRRNVRSHSEVAAVGRVLAPHRWISVPRMSMRQDVAVASMVPEGSAPFMALQFMARAFNADLAITYREPTLSVRRADGSVLHSERIVRWSLNNDNRPSSGDVYGYDACTGFVITHLQYAWADPEQRFVIVVLASQGGGPAACAGRRNGEHDRRPLFIVLPNHPATPPHP